MLPLKQLHTNFHLSPEVYATREKNGVYIPKERYYQEESDRKVLHIDAAIL